VTPSNKRTAPELSGEETPSPRFQPAETLELERRRLETFAREQFRLIREAREALLTEKQASEKFLEERRQDLQQREKLLNERVVQQQSSEAKVQASEVKPPEPFEEDAIAERHKPRRGTPPPPRRPDEHDDSWASIEKVVIGPSNEIQTLRLKLQEQEIARKAAESELDATLDEMDRLRAQLAEATEPPLLGGLEEIQEDDQLAHAEIALATTREQLSRERQLREAHEQRVLHLDAQLTEALAMQSDIDTRAQALEERAAALEDLAERLEAERKEIATQGQELRLREAELREMKEITEQESAAERCNLTLERLRIARLREAVRLQGESKDRVTTKENVPDT
jgi:hypothetical protein